jgi:hypothetical protein
MGESLITHINSGENLVDFLTKVTSDIKHQKWECKVRFSLAHSAPIMNSLLGEKLRYLLMKPWHDQ